ncbi:MAG: pyridoxamine 5'-phosphate oxidase family protein, partial [Pseudomonadota bacterium]
FFVATAGAEGRVNLSPKGLESLHIDNAAQISWLNLTGSGNETAAHVLENKRMTMMFCSFGKQPLILRVYGDARMISLGDQDWPAAIAKFPEYAGARQVFELNIDLVQTSCGYAVPYYDFTGERETLDKWAAKKTSQEILDYQQEKNRTSLDNKPTGLPKA